LQFEFVKGLVIEEVFIWLKRELNIFQQDLQSGKSE
jgi:hypothetical protein